MTRNEAQAMIDALVRLRESATDEQAIASVDVFPSWKPNKPYSTGYRVQYNGTLYRVIQNHTSQTDWTPNLVPSLFEVVCISHTGTMGDPIPYEGNMALECGKYYIQEGVTYLCNRDSGNPVYHALAALVGLYVEVS